MKKVVFKSISFNEPDLHGRIHTKDSINEEELIRIREEGKIHSYEIKEDGLYITMLLSEDSNI
jgi:uncharacterized protein YuzE